MAAIATTTKGDLRNETLGGQSRPSIPLDHLEGPGGAGITMRTTFGMSRNDQVLALVLQDGLPWLVFSISNFADENHVFAVWDSEPIPYSGSACAGSTAEYAKHPRYAFKRSER